MRKCVATNNSNNTDNANDTNNANNTNNTNTTSPVARFIHAYPPCSLQIYAFIHAIWHTCCMTYA